MMEFHENQAIYLQIADHFCENILQKTWKEGEKIPSVRETAVMVEVNPNTALRSFNYLQEQGIIYNKRGIGYHVADQGYQRALLFKKQQFIQEELPRVFRSMDLLGLDFDDLRAAHQTHLKTTQNTNEQ